MPYHTCPSRIQLLKLDERKSLYDLHVPIEEEENETDNAEEGNNKKEGQTDGNVEKEDNNEDNNDDMEFVDKGAVKGFRDFSVKSMSSWDGCPQAVKGFRDFSVKSTSSWDSRPQIEYNPLFTQ